MAGRYIVYAQRKDRTKVTPLVTRILESYDTFLLVEANDDQVAALRDAGFTVEEREAQAIPTRSLDVEPTPVPPGRHHFIVTFIGPVQAQWLTEIKDLGGIPREPMPPYAYVVNLDREQVHAVRSLPYVESVEWYDPASRVVSQALEALKPAPEPEPTIAPPETEVEDAFAPPPAEDVPDEADIAPPGVPPAFEEPLLLSGMVRVSFYTREDRDRAAVELEAEGVDVNPLTDESDTDLIIYLPEEEAAARDVLTKAAYKHGVQSVEPVILPGTSNNVAAQLIGVTTVRDQHTSSPLTGDGEIVGVVDTGLDTGDPATIHPDLKGRIARIVSWPISSAFRVKNAPHQRDDGPADKGSSHGTHVTGSIVGTGKAAIDKGHEPIRGMAPGARVFFQAVQQWTRWSDTRAGYALTGLPADIRRVLQQAYSAGARVYNISITWGGYGRYDLIARYIDDFIWTHPDMVVIVAAGNAGADKDRDGHTDLGSVGSPGTAKNVICVGASESLRQGLGWNKTWGEHLRSRFSVPPQSTDHPSNDPNHVAAFSGRGPTKDGRIKPDVVAPGTNIVSLRSRAYLGVTPGWGLYPALSDYYFVNGGTSMAAPLVTGAAALVREYLRKVKRRHPSAALVKAMIIHSAQYHFDPLNPGSGPYDYAQGWGRVHIDTVLFPTPPRRVRVYERRRGLVTGEHITRWADVLSSETPFKVTLVWTDPPGSPNHPRQLVNNLNLIVIAPDGTQYYGNQFTPPYNRAFDRVNNVEQVLIPNPIPGRYYIRVQGENILRGPQGFALVWSGIIR